MKRLALVLAAAATLTACGGGGGDDPPATSNDSPILKYTGTWNVVYTGQDRGTCTLSITNNGPSKIQGEFTGSCRSSALGVSFSASGTVDSLGGLSSASATTGARLNGSLLGSNGSGTWSNSGASGTWTATKG